MSFKRVFAALLAVILVFCSFAVSTQAIEPERLAQPLKLIDLSEHNGKVNWEVTSKETDGAILRIGYRGEKYRQNIAEDLQFSNNITGVVQYNVPYGIYFYSFATTTAEAVEEAQWTIARLKSYNSKPTYPIFFDMEEDEQRDNLNSRQRTDIIHTFCRVMEEAGYCAGVYSNLNWMTTLLIDSELAKYPVWLARFGPVCEYTGKYNIWQKSCEGIVPGISTKVDISECYYDYPAFIKKYGYNGFEGNVDIDSERKLCGTYRITADSVDVRTGPGDSMEKIGTFVKGNEIYIDCVSGNWGTVLLGTRTGWVKLSGMTKISDHISTVKNAGYYVVNTDVLNVRSEPTTERYNVQEQIYYGDNVFLQTFNNGWGGFYKNGKTLWIFMEYVDFYPMICFDTGIEGKYISPVKVKAQAQVTLPQWKISAEGKQFTGWAESKGGAVKYADKGTVTTGNSNIILYASFKNTGKPFTYTVKPKFENEEYAVISDTQLTKDDFLKKYITLSSGFSCSMKPLKGSLAGTGSEITFTASAGENYVLHLVVLGDCNGDGVCDGIDLADAINISKGAECKLEYSQYQKKAADINLDGKVDSSDLDIIKNAAFGIGDLPA